MTPAITVRESDATGWRPLESPEQSLGCVLFLCPAYDCRYPSETMWQRLDALRRLGPVRVMTFSPRQRELLAPPPGVRIECVVDKTGRWSLLRYPGRVRDATHACSGKGRSGLIWANSNLLTRRAAFAAAGLTGWPVVFDVWDTPDLPFWSQYREGRYAKALAHRLMSVGMARDLETADMVVWTLHPKAARRYFHPDDRKLLLLPNGFRGGELAFYEKPRNGLSAPESGRPRRLLYLGYFQRSRGSDVAVEVLAGLIQGGLPAELDIVGDASSMPVRAAMERVPERLRSSIHFHGHKPWEQAMELVRAADVCLYPFPRHPELKYIYPLKLLEYVALNKRIVSSDLPGARLLLRDYPNVRFCNPARPADWVTAVKVLSNAPSLEQEFSARDRFFHEYSWDVLNGKLLDRVHMLLKQSGSGGRD